MKRSVQALRAAGTWWNLAAPKENHGIKGLEWAASEISRTVAGTKQEHLINIKN